jgi:hypothetical protein
MIVDCSNDDWQHRKAFPGPGVHARFPAAQVSLHVDFLISDGA